MRLNLLLASFLACSLISCKEGPKLTVCVVDAPKQGCDCYDQLTQQSSFLTLEECDKFVAMSAQDTQTLINYCSK